MQSNWDRYELLVVEALERLERKNDSLDGFLREHMKEEEARHAAIAERLTKIEANNALQSRINGGIMGMISAFMATIIQGLFHGK